jgi:hypothetical protein
MMHGVKILMVTILFIFYGTSTTGSAQNTRGFKPPRVHPDLSRRRWRNWSTYATSRQATRKNEGALAALFGLMAADFAFMELWGGFHASNMHLFSHGWLPTGCSAF